VKEAWENLDAPRLVGKIDAAAARSRLAELMESVEIVAADPDRETSMVFCGWELRDPKDMSILLEAINGSCRYLLTSDSKHFGPFFGQTTCGLTVLPPGAFLARMGLPHERPSGSE
jgi:predicted nucleic acid-binding protein